jgi:hypothetical protein
MNDADNRPAVVGQVEPTVRHHAKPSARWRYARKELPPVNEKNGDSEHLLCVAVNDSTPFVGWYNAKTDSWAVSHWKADSLPVRVHRWRDLPKVPATLYL